jgi:hypothetical protein
MAKMIIMVGQQKVAGKGRRTRTVDRQTVDFRWSMAPRGALLAKKVLENLGGTP